MKASLGIIAMFFTIPALVSFETIHGKVNPENNNKQASATANSEYWVFAGQYSPQKKAWLTRYFEFEDFPKAGQTIKATRLVNKRKSLPLKENDYRLPPASGSIKAGESIEIAEVKNLVGNFYWVKIK